MPGKNSLVLEILKQPKGLKMSVFEQGDFSPTLRHYSEVSVPWEEIEDVCSEIAFVLNNAGRVTGEDPPLSGVLQKNGQLLWDQLLSKPVKDRLRSSLGRDLIFSLDEELAGIPWELLHDGREFVSLKFNSGRLLHTKEQPVQLQYRSQGDYLKMLILANPTGDLKAAYAEGLHIKNHFDSKRKEAVIDFKSTSIDGLYVKRNLRDYDIVHFAGHCEYDDKDPENTGWILNDSKFTSRDILSLSQSSPLPSLIFSNSCHSAGKGPGVEDSSCRERNYNLASAFLFSGVRHYIGTIRRIEDSFSLSFAMEFYNRLISGASVGSSVRFARLKMIKEHGGDAVSWGSYILYGDPGFSLFPAGIKSQGKKKRPSGKYLTAVICASLLALGVLSMHLLLPGFNPSDQFVLKKAGEFSLKGDNVKAVEIYSGMIKKKPYLLSAYTLLAQSYQKMGQRELALQAYFEYARRSEANKDMHNLALAYINLGWFYQSGGDYKQAFDFYDKALRSSRENRDELNEAIALRKLAVWHMDNNDYNMAMELLMKSSEINRRHENSLKHRHNLACDYFDIGLAFVNKDDYATAREFYEKSRILFEKLKSKDELSDVYFNLGEVCLFEKKYQKALEYYLSGLKIDQSQGNKPNMAAGYNMLGEFYAQMDDPKRAEEFFNKSAALSKEIKLLPELADAKYNLGALYKKQGDKSRAREYFRDAQEIYYRIDKNRYQEIKEELFALSPAS